MSVPLRLLTFWASALLLAGCAAKGPPPAIKTARHGRGFVVTPVVAVTAFENRGGFNSQWNVGEGMADLLSAALLDTGELLVVERKHIRDVLSEIQLQDSALFRAEGRALRGRLRNARYLVRGTVTDFTVTDISSGWFSIPLFRIGGSRTEARVAIAMQLVDVENGDILGVIKSEGTATARGASAQVNYKQLSFGGDAFSRTPLGKATGEAIEDATSQLMRAIPEQPWTPLVAEAAKSEVLINGGSNTRMRAGTLYSIRGPEQVVTDPLTGNIISRAPGKETGRVRVTEVHPEVSRAAILSGTAKRGDRLVPLPPENP